MKMNIILWLKKVFKKFFPFLIKKNPTVEKTTIASNSDNVGNELKASAFQIETNSTDLLNELSKLKDDVASKLLLLNKKVKDFDNLKIEASRAVAKSERTESLLIYGFIFLVITVSAMAFSYIEFVYSGSKNDDYKYNISEKLNSTKNEIDFLKICLASNKWLNPDCFK